MSIKIVTNVNGSSAKAKLPSGYTSWKNFWEEKTGLEAIQCQKVGCLARTNIVGAHVQVEGYGNSWYIVPLCQSDNMFQDPFYAFGPFVPVNNDNPIIY